MHFIGLQLCRSITTALNAFTALFALRFPFQNIIWITFTPSVCNTFRNQNEMDWSALKLTQTFISSRNAVQNARFISLINTAKWINVIFMMRFPRTFTTIANCFLNQQLEWGVNIWKELNPYLDWKLCQRLSAWIIFWYCLICFLQLLFSNKVAGIGAPTKSHSLFPSTNKNTFWTD